MNRRLPKVATLALDEYAYLPREELLALWEQKVGQAPPKAMSTTLILRAIVYWAQVNVHGGLKRPELNVLIKSAKAHAGSAALQVDKDASEIPTTAPGSSLGSKAPESSKATASRLRSTPKFGTRLIRNWQGKAHVVEVSREGFNWNGKIYGSLSVIAKEITGTHQSGPRFFRT